MVKRVKEAKTIRSVAVMDQLHHAQPSIGVRTRAKTMALKKSFSNSIIMEDIMDNNGDDGGYLQLRSRRLKRHVPPLAKKAKKKKCTPTKDKKEIASLKIEEDEVKEKDEEQLEIGEKSKNGDYNEDEEGSYGDNELDFENKDRITRETTPSTLIEGSDIINTPTSSNKSATNVNAIKKLQTEDPVMPSPEELEAFLSRLEKQNIDRFIKEYNFDPVNEKPLEGRYEWVEFTP